MGCNAAYGGLVRERREEAEGLRADALVRSEQRLDFSCYLPGGFGTGGCLVVADQLRDIIDFKYGQGVLVDAEENEDLTRKYGVMQAPTLVVVDGDHARKYVNASNIQKFVNESMVHGNV